jgi:hypothetical protein
MRTLQTPGFKPFPSPQAIRADGTALLSREVLSVVGHGNKEATICSGFVVLKEPSDGLEPSTPSLPWNFARNRWQPVATDLACFRRFRAQRICH